MKGCRQGWGTTSPTIPVQQHTRLSETLCEKFHFNENLPNARPNEIWRTGPVCLCDLGSWVFILSYNFCDIKHTDITFRESYIS